MLPQIHAAVERVATDPRTVRLRLYRWSRPCLWTPRHQRCGIVLELTIGGRRTFGEAAPLLGWNQDHAALVEREAYALPTHSLLQNWPGWWSNITSPSLRWAMSCAAVSVHLQPQPHRHASSRCVRGGGASWCQALHDPCWASQARCTLKCKVGRLSPEQALVQLRQLLQRFPHSLLRLDASGLWGCDQVLWAAARLPPERVDYWEAPCPVTDWARLSTSGLNVAADFTEPVGGAVEGPHAMAPIWVVKPALLGSLEENLHILEVAARSKKRVVISSTGEGPSTAAWLLTLAPREEVHGLAPLSHHTKHSLLI